MTMPVFTIKAKDRLALGPIRVYRDLCRAAGLNAQAEQVNKAINEFIEWREQNPDAIKNPDHVHVPADS